VLREKDLLGGPKVPGASASVGALFCCTFLLRWQSRGAGFGEVKMAWCEVNALCYRGAGRAISLSAFQTMRGFRSRRPRYMAKP
jgi:hypothetical protein